MSISENPCAAANCWRCCRDIDMDLSWQERQYLEGRGSSLTPKREWNLFDRNRDTYRLSGGCSENIGGVCRVHGSENQPECCKRFQFGKKKCLDLQRK